jgi:hypothetical protein
VHAWLARWTARIGARSPNPRILTFALMASARTLPRTARGLAAAERMASDGAWEVRYVAALVLGECWNLHRSNGVLVALANDRHDLVRAALARGVAEAGVPAEGFAALDPACVRIANHARRRIAGKARGVVR